MSITRGDRVGRINERFRIKINIVSEIGERMRRVIGAKEKESERGEWDV